MTAPQPFDTRTSDDGETLIVTFDEVKSGWEQYILVTSDRHWDSVHTDRAMQKRHLDQARDRGALVMDLGDLFDAMQGRDDRRGSKSSIRPEHQGADYFDRLTETAAEYFAPYADRFLLMGTGNHETSILRHHEINLTWQLARKLNAQGGNIHLGKYAGYVLMQFRRGKRTYSTPILAHYNHGTGGNAPVTKGTLHPVKRAAYIPDANVVFAGHIHQSWLFPVARWRVTAAGRVYKDIQRHVQIPSYKQPDPHAGWEAERGMPPALTGAIWWRLYYHNDEVRSDFTWAE